MRLQKTVILDFNQRNSLVFLVLIALMMYKATDINMTLQSSHHKSLHLHVNGLLIYFTHNISYDN